MSPALDGYDRPGRTRRGLKAYKAAKRALGADEPPEGRRIPDPPPEAATGPPRGRTGRVQRQERESENAPVNAGADLAELFGLDGGGLFECVFCDEHGSESPAHDPGCSARSIPKRRI
jgi:hypothetical protein